MISITRHCQQASFQLAAAKKKLRCKLRSVSGLGPCAPVRCTRGPSWPPLKSPIAASALF
jgi:hypothetical protein